MGFHAPHARQIFAGQFVTDHGAEAQEAVVDNPIVIAKNTISAVREQTSRAILFYSCGKDSIMLLDLMAPVFDEVVCVFMYLVPELSHIDRYLKDAQRRYKNIKVIQVPHFRLTTIHREGIYCKARTVKKLLNLSDIDEQIRKETGVEWSFYGMKKSDGLNRRLMLMSYGALPIQPKTKRAYPLSSLTNKDVLAYIRQRRLPAPVQYGGKQSNGVDFNLDCFLWLRKHEPSDLDKIYKAYPLSKKILFEYDFKASEVRGENDTPERDTERALQPANDQRLPAERLKKEPKESRVLTAHSLE